MRGTEWLSLLFSYCISHHTRYLQKLLALHSFRYQNDGEPKSSFLPNWAQLPCAQQRRFMPRCSMQCRSKTCHCHAALLHAKQGVLIWSPWWLCVTISQRLAYLPSDSLRQYIAAMFFNTSLLIFSRARNQSQATALTQRESTALLPNNRTMVSTEWVIFLSCKQPETCASKYKPSFLCCDIPFMQLQLFVGLTPCTSGQQTSRTHGWPPAPHPTKLRLVTALSNTENSLRERENSQLERAL